MALTLEPLPPREAIDYLAGKGYQVGFSWMDVYAEEHARAFTVAKMMRMDLLQTVHEAVTRSIAEGRTLREFAAELKPLLQREGWWGRQDMTDPATGETKTVQLGSPRRLQIIYDSNIRTAYSVGRYQRFQRAKGRLPLFVYRSMRDARVRPLHRQWNGVALPQDDPWWETHFPPNGWNCRCIAYAISEADAARLPEVKRQAPPIETRQWVNPRTGEVRYIPVGIDPGWDYHVGKAGQAQRAARLYAEKLAGMPVDIAAVAFALDKATILPALQQAYSVWSDGVLAERQPSGGLMVVGALDTRELAFLRGQQAEPASVAITLGDRELLHMAREAKQQAGKSLSLDDLQRIPELLAQPEAILWDKRDPALVYVFTPTGDERKGKLVVRVDYQTRFREGEQRLTVRTNSVRTGGLVEIDVLLDRTRYDPVEGEL